MLQVECNSTSWKAPIILGCYCADMVFSYAAGLPIAKSVWKLRCRVLEGLLAHASGRWQICSTDSFLALTTLIQHDPAIPCMWSNIFGLIIVYASEQRCLQLNTTKQLPLWLFRLSSAQVLHCSTNCLLLGLLRWRAAEKISGLGCYSKCQHQVSAAYHILSPQLLWQQTPQDWCLRTYVDENASVKWCPNPVGCQYACEYQGVELWRSDAVRFLLQFACVFGHSIPL